MRLLEYQAKRLLAAHGIPVPKGRIVLAPGDLPQDGYPAVLKAQVPAGGRGKAGGIVRVETAHEASEAAERLFGAMIRGIPVRQILVEDAVPVERELYLGVTVDKEEPVGLLLASAMGGIEIEAVGKTASGEILSFRIDPCFGLVPPMQRYLASRLSVEPARLTEIISALLEIFSAHDATLVEINPLAAASGALVALDAKIILDDHATFRHTPHWTELAEEQGEGGADGAEDPATSLRALGISHVPLDGEIALISDGAGTGMLTLDLIEDAGGRAADFCELGGAAGAETIERALSVVTKNRNAKALLISLLGGLTRMDEIAAGILAYLGRSEIPIPVVVRMSGTKEEEGRAMLQRAGIATLDDLPEAVRTAVQLARGN